MPVQIHIGRSRSVFEGRGVGGEQQEWLALDESMWARGRKLRHSAFPLIIALHCDLMMRNWRIIRFKSRQRTPRSHHVYSSYCPHVISRDLENMWLAVSAYLCPFQISNHDSGRTHGECTQRTFAETNVYSQYLRCTRWLPKIRLAQTIILLLSALRDGVKKKLVKFRT